MFRPPPQYQDIPARNEMNDVREQARKAIEGRNIRLARESDELRELNRRLDRKFARQQRLFRTTIGALILTIVALLGWIWGSMGAAGWWAR